jgi:hypothetical protein
MESTQQQQTQHYLAAREQTWQLPANKGGKTRENEVFDVLKTYFATNAEYEVTAQPSLFDQLYLEVDYASNPSSYQKPAEKTKGATWYDADKREFREYTDKLREKRSQCGIVPDLMIRNKKTGKMHFAEIKNQGDSGNAHERCGKYATGILAHMKRKMNVAHHPISYIFGGPMVTKRKYLLELKTCYSDFAPGHLVLLTNADSNEAIILDWFTTVVKPLLD